MILYALIARGRTVLAEHVNNMTGNFTTITRVLLGKIDTGTDGKMSYVYDQHVFHYIVENNLTYMCMCENSSKRRIPFAFLEDIKRSFIETYGESAQKAIAFSMSHEYGKVMATKMDNFNNSQMDNIAIVGDKIDDVKNVMVQNIEMVLERGEKLELLVDKTEALQQESVKFLRNATSVRDAMWWQKVRMYCCIAFVVALIIFIITWIACGLHFEKCKGDDSNN